MSLAFYDTKRKMQQMAAGMERLSKAEALTLQEMFDVVWVYHDSALEGEVHTPEELQAALSDRVVTVVDAASTLVMREIRAHKAGIDFVRREAQKRTAPDLLELSKTLHEVLCPSPVDRPGRYRRSSQVQRTYFHDIAEANRISYLLRKILTWATSEDASRDHAIEVASRVHFEFVHIYPFERHAGKVGRLLLNYMLLREGYAPAVIHAQDRQRYYESFRAGSPEQLTALVHESIENSIDSVLRRLRAEGRAPAAAADVGLR